MKCLFCESAIPLVQSLRHRKVPFCCDAHREAYHTETQRLMLARLRETLNRYSNGRPQEVMASYQLRNEPQEVYTAIAIPSLVTG
jgi:hypothetical protein